MENKLSKRDLIAIEVMKELLHSQGRYRRMTLLSKIKYWLGGKGKCSDWVADYDYNHNQIAEKSYIIADRMIKEGERTEAL